MKLGILFGGKSAEHDISLRSAYNIYQSLLESQTITPVLIGITKEGHWIYRQDNALLHLPKGKKQPLLQAEQALQVVLPPASRGQLWELGGKQLPIKLDVIFPVLHGPLGEDGAMQGLLKISETPFIGPDVLGSAVGMDKDIMKKLLHEAGIPIGAYITLRMEDPPLSFEEAKARLGLPIYVKPANMGSSVGISKVSAKEQWEAALKEAFRYDTKIVLEENIEGRELECAVLGNEHPEASAIGEIAPAKAFYDYEAKYLSDEDAELLIPAPLDEQTARRIRQTAIRTYKALACSGLGRVDVFLKENGDILVNEINTLPGFTNISMYPKLWEYSGLPYTDLIHKLAELAIERHQKWALVQK